jgi:hypothetical protein
MTPNQFFECAAVTGDVGGKQIGVVAIVGV